MPNGGNFHINKALSNLAIKYRNAEFIHDKVFNTLRVNNESDLFYAYTRDFRIPDSGRSNGSPANFESWSLSTDNYNTKEEALSDIVTSRDEQNADSPLQLGAETVEFLQDKIMMKKEKELADLIFTTTAAGNSVTLNTATSWRYNTTTSAPIEDMNSACSVVIQASGVKPNMAVMGEQVFTAVKNNTNVFERIKYVERAIMTKELLASVFDLDRVEVGYAIYDSAQESIPTAIESITAIWGNDVWVGYVNPSTSRKKLTAGVTFESRPWRVRSWKDDAREGTVYEVSNMYVHQITATQAAFVFKTAALPMS